MNTSPFDLLDLHFDQPIIEEEHITCTDILWQTRIGDADGGRITHIFPQRGIQRKTRARH